jgi:hypothetical protein
MAPPRRRITGRTSRMTATLRERVERRARQVRARADAGRGPRPDSFSSPSCAHHRRWRSPGAGDETKVTLSEPRGALPLVLPHDRSRAPPCGGTSVARDRHVHRAIHWLRPFKKPCESLVRALRDPRESLACALRARVAESVARARCEARCGCRQRHQDPRKPTQRRNPYRPKIGGCRSAYPSVCDGTSAPRSPRSPDGHSNVDGLPAARTRDGTARGLRGASRDQRINEDCPSWRLRGPTRRRRRGRAGSPSGGPPSADRGAAINPGALPPCRFGRLAITWPKILAIAGPMGVASGHDGQGPPNVAHGDQTP